MDDAERQHLSASTVLLKNILDNFFGDRLLRCEKKVIDYGVSAIAHRQRMGNKLEACDRLKPLLKRLHKLPWSLSA
jgi:hypothetical protein